jgi:hypothetical protein
MKDYIQYSHVGILFITTFMLFVYGGVQLDKKMNVQPLFTILGVTLGFVLACYKLIKDTEVKKKIVKVFCFYFLIVTIAWGVSYTVVYGLFGTEKLFDLSLTTVVMLLIMTIALTSKIILLHKFSDGLVSFYVNTSIRFFGVLTSLLYFRTYHSHNLSLVVILCVIFYFLTLIYDTVYVERQLNV